MTKAYDGNKEREYLQIGKQYVIIDPPKVYNGTCPHCSLPIHDIMPVVPLFPMKQIHEHLGISPGYTNTLVRQLDGEEALGLKIYRKTGKSYHLHMRMLRAWEVQRIRSEILSVAAPTPEKPQRLDRFVRVVGKYSHLLYEEPVVKGAFYADRIPESTQEEVGPGASPGSPGGSGDQPSQNGSTTERGD